MKTSIHLETQNRQSALHQQLCGICMAKDVSSIGKLETESKLGRHAQHQGVDYSKSFVTSDDDRGTKCVTSWGIRTKVYDSKGAKALIHKSRRVERPSAKYLPLFLDFSGERVVPQSSFLKIFRITRESVPSYFGVHSPLRIHETNADVPNRIRPTKTPERWQRTPQPNISTGFCMYYENESNIYDAIVLTELKWTRKFCCWFT